MYYRDIIPAATLTRTQHSRFNNSRYLWNVIACRYHSIIICCCCCCCAPTGFVRATAVCRGARCSGAPVRASTVTTTSGSSYGVHVIYRSQLVCNYSSAPRVNIVSVDDVILCPCVYLYAVSVYKHAVGRNRNVILNAKKKHQKTCKKKKN